MYDILINCSYIITMDKERKIIPQGSIGIKDGCIESVGRKELYPKAKKIIEGENLVAIPGLINCHTHVYQALIEGIGYDMHFSPWNIQYLLPLVSHIGPEHSRSSAELAALEMIKSGTTTFSDHWYLHTDFSNIDEVARVFHQSGLRNHSVSGFLNESFAGWKKDVDTEMVKNEEALIDAAKSFIKKWHKKGRTIVALGPGSTEDVSRDFFKKIVVFAKEMDVSVVTHIAGWIEIVSNSLKKYKMRDLEYAHSLGFTGEKAIAVHCVWLSAEEMNIIANTGTKVVHNPVANMHLGYGIAPITEMLSRGVTVGLGTDGAASYTYDMFEIGKTAAMLQKVKNLDAEAITAEKILEMLTIDGAKVLGMDSFTGSIEKGKRADIILLDFNCPHIMPGGKVVPKIVYSARGADVVTSIIDGKTVMENRKVLNLNEEKVIKNAQRMRNDLCEKAGQKTANLLDAPWPSNKAAWRMN
ncbi:amidohydrolase [bacterium]|nr:amidohydrolase [bacterium]MBU4510726.1 amidohydrolase [bacterium]